MPTAREFHRDWHAPRARALRVAHKLGLSLSVVPSSTGCSAPHDFIERKTTWFVQFYGTTFTGGAGDYLHRRGMYIQTFSERSLKGAGKTYRKEWFFGYEDSCGERIPARTWTEALTFVLERLKVDDATERLASGQ